MQKDKTASSEEIKEVIILIVYLCLAGFIGFAFWRVLFTQYWYVSSHILAFLTGSIFGFALLTK